MAELADAPDSKIQWPQGREGSIPSTERGMMNKLEVTVGLEPTKVGFADRRLDHFGIATLYPNLYPKLYPNRPRIAYLPHTISLEVVDSACDRANEMVLQTIALPLGDRATGLRSLGGETAESNVRLPACCVVLHQQILTLKLPDGSKDPPLREDCHADGLKTRHDKH
jgi:hypothetical protein